MRELIAKLSEISNDEDLGPGTTEVRAALREAVAALSGQGQAPAPSSLSMADGVIHAAYDRDEDARAAYDALEAGRLPAPAPAGDVEKAVEVGDVDEAYLEEVADGAWGDDGRIRGLARDRLAALRAAPHLAPAQGETELLDHLAGIYPGDLDGSIRAALPSPAGTVAAGAVEVMKQALERIADVAEYRDGTGLYQFKPALSAQAARDVAVDALAALRAKPAGAPEEWRSMDSAPRDGTRFLALQGDRHFDCWWYDKGYGEAYWMDEADSEPEPTHWMPLPASPPQGERAAPDEGGRDG